MPSTYTLISSNVLSSSAASVTFSSIPATYTDLVLRISARSNRAGGAGTTDLISLTFNTDNPASGTTYSDTVLKGAGSTASSSRDTSYSTFYDVIMPVTADTANTFSSTEFYIPSYLASTNKQISVITQQENNSATVWGLNALAGLWRNTAAINQIVLTDALSTFVSGSSFYLYGIKNS